MVASSDQENDEGTKESLSSRLTALGAVEVWRSRFTNVVHFDVPIASLGALDLEPLVAAYELNRAGGGPLQNYTVPAIGVSSSTSDYWPSAWGAHYIAVLDTGVSDQPPLFGGVHPRVNHSLGACFSTTSPGFQTLCPNGQDTQYGSHPNGWAGRPCTLNLCAHGTDVASVLVSSHPTWKGVINNSLVKVVPVQIYSRTIGSLAATKIFTDDLNQALDYVLSLDVPGQKVGAVNMSFSLGFGLSQHCDSSIPTTSDYLQKLRNGKIAPVAAAGNCFSSTPGCSGWNSIDAPACSQYAVNVAASRTASGLAEIVAVDTIAGTNSYFSTKSNNIVNFWAPGTHIDTPYQSGLFGTSYAAPHVAGIITRLRGKYPTWTIDQILAEINARCTVSLSDTRVVPNIVKKRICYSTLWN